jgi:hypothetical protein
VWLLRLPRGTVTRAASFDDLVGEVVEHSSSWSSDLAPPEVPILCLTAPLRRIARVARSSQLSFPRGRPLECRAASRGVRGRDRRVSRCGPSAAAGVPMPTVGDAHAPEVVEAYYLQRTRFESIAERKLRRRQFSDRNAWGLRPQANSRFPLSTLMRVRDTINHQLNNKSINFLGCPIDHRSACRRGNTASYPDCRATRLQGFLPTGSGFRRRSCSVRVSR